MQRAQILAAACLACCACSLKKMTVDQTAGILADAGRAFDMENDVELARAAIPASLKTTEGFLQAHPEQETLLRILAEGYTNYGFAFLEDEADTLQETQPAQAEHLRQRALNLYRRAREYGLRLLALDEPDLAETLRSGQMPDAASLAELDATLVPGLFWTANPWGLAINLTKSEPASLIELQVVTALMQRCAELDSGYFFGGPELALGALAAGLPVALGGRPDNAKTHFETALVASQGQHLMTKVVYARAYGLQTGDRGFFERSLAEVLLAKADAVPALTLANLLAQRRAQRYLAAIDELFLE